MRVGEHEVQWQRDQVEITGPDGRRARARWSGGKLVDREGMLTSSDDAAGLWSAIEETLRLDASTLIAATYAAAYDERGVDVTQIDWMLSLSPGERLKALDAHRNSILRLVGDAPRD